MKKLLFLATLIASTFTFAQTEFNYTPEGLTPKYLVVETPGKSQSEVYQNALGWVKENFKNANAVIQSTIEDNKIRFEGVTPNGNCFKVLGMNSCQDVKYLIDIEFKDGKYRIEPIKYEFYITPSKYSTFSGWRILPLGDGDDYFNKKGELRSNTKHTPTNMIVILNKMNSDLKSYIESGSSNKLNADW